MRRWVRGLLAVTAVALAGCNPTETPDAGSCAPGTQGCECIADKCGKTGVGEQLICMGGTCDVMACPAGERGCVCRGGSTCNTPGDSCTNGFCLAADCTPSSKDCSCIAGSCDVGLTCVSDTVCVDNTGYEGGACLPTGRCYRGARCDGATTQCVYCDPGTAGCQCRTSGGCNAGLACAADLCVSANELPPTNASCFTPCRADLTRDGQTVACGSDGLIPGCLDGQTCTNGSCLEPGQAAPTCTSDVQCPFFQVCLQGGCYANCDVNADCASGKGCFKHACRTSCRVSSGQAACPSGSACVSSDGENGYCLPVGTSTQAATVPQQAGGLHLPKARVDLSNVKPSGEFIVVPRAAITQDVEVRKLWHQITWADGTTERIDAPLNGQGAYRACNAAANECPLWWLNIGAAGSAPAPQEVTTFRLNPGCLDDVTAQTDDAGSQVPCPRVTVGNAAGVQATRWEGVLELSSGSSRTQLYLSYVERPEGQWTGAMYYLSNFNSVGMEPWIVAPNKGDATLSLSVKNAFIQRWATFRRGALQGGWPEMLAVLTSTRTESWKYGNVKQRCAAVVGHDQNVVCYPFTDTPGVKSYVQNPSDSPVPSGVSELPVGFNLRLDPTNPAGFTGRVESSLAMHYPGNPELRLEFEGNPAEATSCQGSTDCFVFLKGLNAVPANTNVVTSSVGGRYLLDGANCDTGFTSARVPWLIPGFTQGAELDTGTGQWWRTECRDQQLPFAAMGPEIPGVNAALAGGNPIPNGAPVQRKLRLIDGVLVNQSELLLLFEESYDNFIPNPSGDGSRKPTTAYGFMRLTRAAADLDATAYTGRPTATGITRTPKTLGAHCSLDQLKLVDPTATSIASIDDTERGNLAKLLIAGRNTTTGLQSLTQAERDRVHYLCLDTGMFNAGRDGYSDCPLSSRIIYFRTVSKTASDIAQDACQTPGQDGRGTCFSRLENDWNNATAGVLADYNVPWQCTAAPDGGIGEIYCDDVRRDLRQGKTFFKAPPALPSPNLIALRPLVDSAFRYKTRFQSSSGGSLGFAPVQCPANSDAVPYCYSPSEIEAARARVDCLTELYSRPAGLAALSPDAAAPLVDYLRGNFSAFRRVLPGGGVETYEGFERLYAELLIMQGDEALTAAYASRFDLAAAGGASFIGSAFETNGIDLTGVAGAEMYNLYAATQYYQLVLDRLYNFGPNFDRALQLGAVVNDGSSNFITPATVTDYLERLVRAASQKSRAWGEIARRYQNFNRPDLARTVIERAYVTTYLESALIARLMFDIRERSPIASQPQIALVLEKAQRTYRMALLDMRDVYSQITDEVNYFGYPPEYIPFPALDSASTGSGNAYEVLSLLSKQRLDLARTREQIALSNARQGRVDAAQFQSDLTSIRNTYENQLAQACGVFTGEDGRVYPAIRKYAHQSSEAVLFGDPCGRMGNGDLHNSMAAVKDARLRLEGILIRHQNILADIAIEQQRVADVCGVMQQRVDYTFNRAQTTSTMQHEMAKQRAMMTFIQGSIQAVMQSMEVLDCEIQCFSSIAQAAVMSAMGIAAAGTQYASELKVAKAEADLREFEAASVQSMNSFECGGALAGDGGTVERGILQIESQARVATMLNDSFEVQVEALRAEYSMRVALADVARGFGNAERLQAQQEEAEQLAIDVQQAQNDPNVRIYQNDSVINADVSFQDALATAYRLTRVYEYYTSQSYARKEQLFLIRMVSAGQYNLENYLLQLDNEFNAFEEEFGNPDVRVMALSLRDDIMKVPYFGNDGRVLSEADRIATMRERLKDVKLLDSRGYLTLPFSTSIGQLSPLTRNHKVRHVEVDLQGVKLGDSTARVYLRMSGTGVVRNVNDDNDFYVFPERLAVINASLLGSKVFDAEVYRNYRFRDRPLVNTLWELVLNLRDEQVNKDIDLQTLTDVRLLIYYSDFTSF